VPGYAADLVRGTDTATLVGSGAKVGVVNGALSWIGGVDGLNLQISGGGGYEAWLAIHEFSNDTNRAFGASASGTQQLFLGPLGSGIFYSVQDYGNQFAKSEITRPGNAIYWHFGQSTLTAINKSSIQTKSSWATNHAMTNWINYPGDAISLLVRFTSGNIPSVGEARQLVENPWGELFAPLPARRYFFSAGGAATHTTTGALTGPGSTVAGTAAHLTLHTTTGALTGAGSSIVGAALHPHTTTGALTGAGSTVVGSAARTHLHPTTGVLTGPGSTVAGTAAHTSPTVDVGFQLDAFQFSGFQGAEAVGTHTTTGALTGPGSAINGTATRLALHTTSGILVGPGAAVAGEASLNGAVAETPAPAVGGRGRRQRRRVIVEIDGEDFEVASEQQGIELLMQARQLADEKAKEASDKAAAKARRKDRPAAQDRALAIPVPQVRLVAPDMEDPLARQMQASVDATNAYFEQVYGAAIGAARRRIIEWAADEEDAITVLLMG
jgi:hypothetical protein